MKDYIKRRIESYRKGDDKRPLIIDFACQDDLQEFSQQYFTLPKKNVFDLGWAGNELPSKSDIYEFMDTSKARECIITGIGTFFRIFGVACLSENIHSILGSSYQTKFIIVTYQCATYFNEKIPKYKENILIVDNQQSLPSSLVFISENFKNTIHSINALKNALIKLESSVGERIFVTTIYKQLDFKDSVIRIESCSTPYDILCLCDAKLKKLPAKYGNDDLWLKLLNKVKNNSIEDTIAKIIDINNPINEVKEWNEKDYLEKWLSFIYFKLKEVKTGNWVIDYAFEKAQKVEEIIKWIYYSIIDLNYKETGFWDKFSVRKKILKDINDDTVVYEYCAYIQYKEENALYYLTDNSDNEKKLILKLIDKYRECYTKQKLLDILQKIYPDLYNYLAFYNMGDDFLTKYFDDYKYLKVVNFLTPEFKALVDHEATERSFKRRLMHRTEKLEELDFTNSIVYFIDALGVEFFSYITKKCEEKGLACRTNIAQANLPTLTAKNTEFRDFFERKGITVKDEKRLDVLKHDGKDDYDFDKNKLPIHIIEEFNIIDSCLDEIRKKIKTQAFKKAIIISDHGATRLAILNTDMVKEDVESAGEHGGRVCKEVPGMKTIPNAIVEDGYCILADYNAIKGGRVGKVEMHGGATLEEVTVPIIEIYEKSTSISVKVLDDVVKVSFKKIAILHLYVSAHLDNLSIKVNGKIYNGKSEDGYSFAVSLDDIKKSGEYKFEVWSDDQLVSTDNTFKVEKESAKNNDLWG